MFCDSPSARWVSLDFNKGATPLVPFSFLLAFYSLPLSPFSFPSPPPASSTTVGSNGPGDHSKCQKLMHRRRARTQTHARERERGRERERASESQIGCQAVECRNICQIGCQIEGQNLCHIESLMEFQILCRLKWQIGCQIECQMRYQIICQLECQLHCQTEIRQNVRQNAV